jgi:fumarylacetoacetate (FAA) hydrolase
MKLARLKQDRRFYYAMIGNELFDFSMVVPQDLRLVTPLDANEYLPVLSAMIERMGGLGRQVERLRRAEPDDFRAFRHPLNPEQLAAPVQPLSFRAFDTYGQHVRNVRQRCGLAMVQEWYEAPGFYFANVASIYGTGAPIRRPAETRELDYALQIAAVIGREGRDIPVAEADRYIVGYTLLNNWCLRDVERREMQVGLGSGKSQDFATSVGPYLVTLDELEPRLLPDRSRGCRYDLMMSASVNGQETSRGNTRDMHWTFAELIAHASRNTVLLPGDLISSGTVSTGCLADLANTYAWLQPGDVVQLQAEELGVLENTII